MSDLTLVYLKINFNLILILIQRVKLRADNTFMIKDKAHNNCFAINGREVNGGLLFSYTFSTISAYHGMDDSLNLEIAANSRYLNKQK